MQVWPAIDLRGGKCVRLRQGDYQQETVFAQNPADVARQFAEQGAQHLHIVDLEGAREGLPVNLPGVQEILAAVDIECELGGGIRDEQSVHELFEFGLSRLVIGTSALTDPEWFRAACRQYPGQAGVGHRRPRRPRRHRRLAQHQRRDGDRPGPAVRQRAAGGDYLHRHRDRRNDERPERRCDGRNASGRRCAGDRLGRRDHAGRCRAIGSRRLGRLHYRPGTVRRHLTLADAIRVANGDVRQTH